MRDAYSDVVREAQVAVEISLKGILWNIGVEPPKVHDVGSLILEYREELPTEVGRHADELARISKWAWRRPLPMGGPFAPFRFLGQPTRRAGGSGRSAPEPSPALRLASPHKPLGWTSSFPRLA